MSALPQKKHKLERLEVRINARQKSMYARAAELSGVSVSSLVKSVLEKAAAKIIREHEMIMLSKADQMAFVDAILNPPKPSKKLIKAAKNQKKYVENK